MASHKVARTRFPQHRGLLTAPVGGVGAAVGEGAARLGIDGAGHVAGKHLRLLLGFLIRVGNRHGGQKRLTVGMQGVVIDLVTVCQLYQVAQVHNGNTVGDILDNEF